MIASSVFEKLEYLKVLQYISKYCVTENGKQFTLKLSPLNNLNKIKDEGEYVTQAKKILIELYSPPFEYIPSLEETLSKSRIEGSVIDSKKIIEIYKLSVVSRKLYVFLKNNTDLAPLLFEISQNLFVDKLFEHAITKIIDESGEVRDNASHKLAEIRKEIRVKKDDLVKAVRRIMKSLTDKDIIREDYLTLRDGRIVLPVKVEHKRHIRGFIHSESSTGQTVYIEPEETLELNNDIVSLSFAENREIERLLRELTSRIGESSYELKDSLDTITYLDSIFARANYSIEIIGSFPSFDENKPFFISDARHPILLKKLTKEGTVPLNLEINSKNIVLITGPNAGGKTVVLKTVGILSLMVLTGIHIPASPDSNFHHFTNILLDIGDEQSIEDDLSTFSSHLSNIKNIISVCDKKSLVLLDEIGTGTDPSEGSALATATLLQLHEKESTVLATTHHGSLKLIANELDGFENAAMEFDTRNLKPTYLFKQGIPGSSYAFEVAKRIGFNDNFLNLAKKHLDTDKHKLENFLVQIEGKAKELEDKLKKMEIENSRLNGLSNLYKQNIEKLNKEKKEILKKAKIEADEYLKNINKKFEKVVKELKESNAKKEVIKSSQKVITEIKEKNVKLFDDEVDLKEEKPHFVIGDFVSIKNTETMGEIISISEEKGKATLRVGSLKMQATLRNLVRAKKVKQKSESAPVFSYQMQDAEIRLDIRGQKPETAEFEILKFVDTAYTSGLERIEILHGKGTGVLKKTVGDLLKRHEKVKNFYFAPIEFGGDGITIAELK